MWTVNFLMFKLVLEKAKEPEIKLPISTGSSKKQESSRKISISALLTMPKPLTDAGKEWGWEEKGTAEDEMVGWHHWLDGHGFGWTPGAGDGQGGLVCCGSWGCKESDMTERLNWTELSSLSDFFNAGGVLHLKNFIIPYTNDTLTWHFLPQLLHVTFKTTKMFCIAFSFLRSQCCFKSVESLIIQSF